MPVKDAEVLVLKVLKTAAAKQKYLVHQLKAHWADIVGYAAAKHSQPYKIERRVVYIHTDYPLWSQMLLTSKGLYMNKINQLLALKGTEYTVKDLKAFHGVLEDEPAAGPKTEEPFIPKWDTEHRCPVCGAPLIGDEEICFFCRQKQEQQRRKQLYGMLKETPWLTFDDCRKTVNCDKITFTDVKNRLTEWALGKALAADASFEVKAAAVMLVRGIPPEEIDETTVKKVLDEERGKKEPK